MPARARSNSSGSESDREEAAISVAMRRHQRFLRVHEAIREYKAAMKQEEKTAIEQEKKTALKKTAMKKTAPKKTAPKKDKRGHVFCTFPGCNAAAMFSTVFKRHFVAKHLNCDESAYTVAHLESYRRKLTDSRLFNSPEYAARMVELRRKQEALLDTMYTRASHFDSNMQMLAEKLDQFPERLCEEHYTSSTTPPQSTRPREEAAPGDSKRARPESEDDVLL